MTDHQNLSEKQNCIECGRELFGRTDKRFCNDTCRYSFNRKIRAKEKLRDNQNIPAIFRQIRANYEILKQYHLENLEEGTTIHITKLEILGKGFEPRFCTSVLNKGYNELWLFCFEFGYKKVGERHFELSKSVASRKYVLPRSVIGLWFEKRNLAIMASNTIHPSFAFFSNQTA